ncbi:MAG: CapA family protein, partial [Ignavibacteria bacterium]|nr:CapA family protein [Ignavibacteria bacterium]
NPIPEAKDYLINLIDTVAIQNDILKAKSLMTDLVLIFFHFGDEYEREPNSFQKAIAQKSFEYGADIILGSHPHVVQPFELVKLETNSNLDTGFVIYSLGNFLSNQEGIYKEAGLILQLEIEKNLISNKLRISKVNYIPTWVRKGYYRNKQSHLILPLDEKNFDNFSSRGLELSNAEKDKILRIVNETNSHLNKNKAEKIKQTSTE